MEEWNDQRVVPSQLLTLSHLRQTRACKCVMKSLLCWLFVDEYFFFCILDIVYTEWEVGKPQLALCHSPFLFSFTLLLFLLVLPLPTVFSFPQPLSSYSPLLSSSTTMPPCFPSFLLFFSPLPPPSLLFPLLDRSIQTTLMGHSCCYTKVLS